MAALIENLRGAYHQGIDELDWMSNETKKAAKIKLHAFTPKIGYPERWKNYDALSISKDALIGNIDNAHQINFIKDIKKLGQPIQRWEWHMTPQTVNAYYSSTMNEIVFPAAILQPPFFNLNADNAINYGSIGAVIGHEMGHGFDDQGSKYDEKGNLRNWWTKKDLAAFKVRTKKLINQYNHFKLFDDLSVNGAFTLGENIGDLSGLTIAYKAYKRSLKGKKAPIIDGFTGDQRFFIGFAQIWNAKTTEMLARKYIKIDPHSPGIFRTLGPLSNVEEFYKAFNVKKGDKMYLAPKDRVKIW
jgi:predicted metalloendopeptidase